MNLHTSEPSIMVMVLTLHERAFNIMDSYGDGNTPSIMVMVTLHEYTFNGNIKNTLTRGYYAAARHITTFCIMIHNVTWPAYNVMYI